MISKKGCVEIVVVALFMQSQRNKMVNVVDVDLLGYNAVWTYK
jgi:hypothetical protein